MKKMILTDSRKCPKCNNINYHIIGETTKVMEFECKKCYALYYIELPQENDIDVINNSSKNPVILRIRINSDKDHGYVLRETKMTLIKEHLKTYEIYNDSDIKFIKKEKMNIADTIYNNNDSYICYFTYCLEEDREVSKQNLMSALTNRMDELIKELTVLKDMRVLVEKKK